MPFPAQTVTVEGAWDQFRRRSLLVKTSVQTLVDTSAVGDTARRKYVDLRVVLQDALNLWSSLNSAHPTMQAYARDQINDPTLDLSAEYIAMRDATTALRDWIDSNMPSDTPSGAVLERLSDGTQLTFSTAQTVGFRTEAAALLATIG